MNKKQLLLILAIVCLLIGVFFGATILFNLNKNKIQITTQPQDALVYINGRQINSKVIYLEDGDYIISIIKDGYYENHKTYSINKDTPAISAILTEKPILIGSLIQSDRYDEVMARYPLLEKLPYDNSLVYIDYDQNSTFDSLIITVDASTGYRQGVINKIKALGFNPAEYNIVFKDYESPFSL